MAIKNQGLVDLLNGSIKKIKLAIADDEEVSRKTIIRSIECEHELEVVLEAEDGLHLLEQLKTMTPDVILMDIKMPVMDGLQATREVMMKYPQAKIIALSSYCFDGYIAEMYEKGVKAFLAKGCDESELIKAIHEVNNNGNYVTNKSLAALRLYIKRALGFVRTRSQSSEQPDLYKLSSTELKILWHTASLKSVKEIAEDLSISPNTVNNHQHSIRKKLNLKGSRVLIQYGLSVKEALRKMIDD